MAEFLQNITFAEASIIWVVVILAAVLRSFTGFGFALAAVPAFSLFLSPIQAVVLVSLLTLAVNLFYARNYLTNVPLNPLIPLVVAAIIGTVIGTQVIKSISVEKFQFWVGCSVIAGCLGMIFLRKIRIPVNNFTTYLTGLLSGIMNGSLAIPGPPIIIYALQSQSTPEKSRILLMTFFFASAFIALISYCFAGFVTMQSLWFFLMAFPAMLIGDRLGFYLFNQYGSALYRTIAISCLLVIGVLITLKSIFY
ncbi:sulfite exporter TauE/SafE family protein [Porticoccaceae bacterium]|nr:sulfite exporter TauE/SafE family protein [Porticoccaceae bacterium]